MRAIHVNWTKPYFERHRLRGHGFETTRSIKSDCYDQPDYQVLYTMLSAIYWKKLNGPIKLYTDSIGLEFYRQFRMHELYDELDIDFLNGYSKSSVDPAFFWTSGKIKCLAHQTSPFVFLDQDMIIKTKLPDYTSDLVVAHWEIPRGYYYFEKEDWEKEIKHIEFPKDYNCSDLSPNTSFLMFNNLDVLNEYHNWHKKLVDTKGEYVPEWFWLLTDQGILGHTIRENNYSADTLTDRVFLANSNYSDKSQRHLGKSEQWYYPVDCNRNKDISIIWEHIWFKKIAYGISEEIRLMETKRFFGDIVKLGFSKYLQHSRFKKYWDEYEGENS